MAKRPDQLKPAPIDFTSTARGNNVRRQNLGLDFGPALKEDERKMAETNKKFENIINQSGKILINDVEYKTCIEDLKRVAELGSGTSGHVVKMVHIPSNRTIAVKQMRRSGNPEENNRIIMDLEVVLKSKCPYIVQCLGYIITDSDVWICMEMMSTCMEKLLKRLKEPIPETIIGKVAMATLKALNYLKEKHDVIHRDVKPSNILLDERGNVKLCDFGISGRLVESKAKTRGAGCTGYMAPERINPPDPKNPKYDIRADVWSLGITLVELATGKFPYSDCDTDFAVMTKILETSPPTLPNSQQFTDEFRDFIKLCLKHDYTRRPKYKELLMHAFIKKSETTAVNVKTWYTLVVPSDRQTGALYYQSVGRHSGRVFRTSTNSSPSPSSAGSFVTTPGSFRSGRYEEVCLTSPIRRTPTPSTPGTPSPHTGIPPDPPPRLSRMSSGSDGLRTPTNSSSSGSGNIITTPSPTSVSISSPSPDGPTPPIRRLSAVLLLCLAKGCYYS